MFCIGLLGLVKAAHEAAEGDATGLTEAELTEGLVAVTQALLLLETTQAHLMVQLDTRGTCEREYGLSVSSWLARESGLPRNRARRPLSIGRGLRHLPAIDAAVADGRLTIEHAAALVRLCNPRIAAGLIEAQELFIEWATNTTFEQWQRQVAAFVELLDQDGPHDPDGDLARNQLHCADTIDNTTHLAGTFVGAEAACVRDTIEAKADELFRRYKNDKDVSPELEIPGRATLRAMALVELCRLAGAVDINSTKPPRPEVTLIVKAGEPIPEPSAASDTRAETETETETDGDVEAGPGPSTQRVLPDVVHDARGVRLADATTRTLLCDPVIQTLIVDSLGVPLDLGRTVRYATPAQRKALAARDGGCTFPGCTLPPAWCDAHHEPAFEDGGLTDIAKMALLCRIHHGYTHRNGWTTGISKDGWLYWTTPAGLTFWAQRHQKRRTGPTPT